MRVTIESFTRPDIEIMRAAIARLAGGSTAQEGVAGDVTIDLHMFDGCPGERVDYRASIPSRQEADVSHVDELRDVDEQFSSPRR